jgi:hypothetical protein
MYRTVPGRERPSERTCDIFLVNSNLPGLIIRDMPAESQLVQDALLRLHEF